MNAEEQARRERVIKAAVDTYLGDREQFSMKKIAQRARVKEAEIYRLFNSKNAILKGFYTACVARYREMVAQVEGFAGYSLGEKISTFAFSLFDLLGEQREFVEETFRPLIADSKTKSQFQREVEEILAAFVASSRAASLMKGNPLVGRLLAGQYLRLVEFWLEDESEGCERTMALTDKAVAFAAELLETDLVGKGLDLLKFALANDVLRLELPRLGRVARRLRKLAR